MKYIDAVNSKLTPQAADIEKIFPKNRNSSFSNVLSSEINALSTLPKKPTWTSSNKSAADSRLQPGIVNMPISSAQSNSVAKQQLDKKGGKIDIARICDFVRPAPGTTAADTSADSVDLIQGNPSVAIGKRPSAEVISERYRMDSSSSQKSGPLANGVMVSFRIKMG